MTSLSDKILDSDSKPQLLWAACIYLYSPSEKNDTSNNNFFEKKKRKKRMSCLRIGVISAKQE